MPKIESISIGNRRFFFFFCHSNRILVFLLGTENGKTRNKKAILTKKKRMTHQLVELRNNCLLRDGKSGLFQLHRQLTHAMDSSSCVASGTFRDLLRERGLYVSDELFNLLVKTFSGGQPEASVNVVLFLKAMEEPLLPPRRSMVVNRAFEKLLAVRDLMSSEGKKDKQRSIPFSVLAKCFSARRHPATERLGLAIEDRTNLILEISDRFLKMWGGEDVVSAEEFRAFYAGVSGIYDQEHPRPRAGTPAALLFDQGFELLLVRSWDLDLPPEEVVFGVATQTSAVEQLQRSAAAEAISVKGHHKELKDGHTPHPLYQTSTSIYGKECTKGAEHSLKKFNLNGHFTNGMPRPSPGSSLNTSTTRTKV